MSCLKTEEVSLGEGRIKWKVNLRNEEDGE